MPAQTFLDQIIELKRALTAAECKVASLTADRKRLEKDLTTERTQRTLTTTAHLPIAQATFFLNPQDIQIRCEMAGKNGVREKLQIAPPPELRVILLARRDEILAAQRNRAIARNGSLWNKTATRHDTTFANRNITAATKIKRKNKLPKGFDPLAADLADESVVEYKTRTVTRAQGAWDLSRAETEKLLGERQRRFMAKQPTTHFTDETIKIEVARILRSYGYTKDEITTVQSLTKRPQDKTPKVPTYKTPKPKPQIIDLSALME